MPFRLSPTFREDLAARRGGDASADTDRAATGRDRALAGMWVCSGSPLVAEIAAGSGLDWLLIDMEHSPLTLQSVLAQLQAVAAYPITPVVRVPDGDTVTIKQVLDLGAQNLLVPMVSTAEQARATVEAVHYPPRGRRGVGSALARSARWNRVEGYLQEAAEHVSLFVQIESAQAVENVEEILAVDGIDGIFVGPSDLAASLGVIGQQTHPQVLEGIRRALAAARAAGKPVGINAFDPQVARGYIDDGVDFILVGADVALLARGSEKLAADFIGVGGTERASY